MLKEKSFLLAASISFMIGICCAGLTLLILPSLDLRPTHQLFQTFGIRKQKVVGFFPFWLIKKVDAESLDNMNTVTYFSLTIDTDGTILRQNNPQENEPGWQTLKNDAFGELTKDIPGYQADRSLLLHISDEASISALLQDPTKHATNLVTDAEPLMQEYSFTDLNLDIESYKTATPEDQAKMAEFLKEVKNQLVLKELGTLTIELTVSSLINDQLLKPQTVGEIADTVVLMAYDFHYTGSVIAGPVAPVGGATINRSYDVVESVKLITQVIPSEKILLGIPLYGYEWETLSYVPESPVIPGTGKTATPVRVAEILETCDGCSVQRDEVTGSPYLVLPPTTDSAIQQLYFEDATSVQKKLGLAQEYKLAGVALWAIGYENAEVIAPLKQYKKIYTWN